MDSVTLTVLFEDPFWIGLFERISNGMLSVCKVTFGAEPKDSEVYELILKQYNQLAFSPVVETKRKAVVDNPKRRQRRIKRQLLHTGIGTKSQQALQLQREQTKTEKNQIHREQREAQKKRIFALKQQRRKQKHKGH